MIRIHKEGLKPLFIALVVFTILYVVVFSFISTEWIVNSVLIIFLILYVFMINFFRNPPRHLHSNPNHVVAPADGKIVAIEEVEETEYFKDKRIQISIFMSPLNVHVNRYPVGGRIAYAKYHPGAFLVAWHPKSSFLNERTTVVIDGEKTGPVLYKQIAGALARRIIMYAKEGLIVKQGADSGFIRFGSRVDVLLPLGANIKVKVGDKPKGNETILADFSE